MKDKFKNIMVEYYELDFEDKAIITWFIFLVIFFAVGAFIDTSIKVIVVSIGAIVIPFAILFLILNCIGRIYSKKERGK